MSRSAHARRPLYREGSLCCNARVACCARCCVQCTHGALCNGGGSSLGCSTFFTCCARWFAQCTHANVCDGGGSTRFACCVRCFTQRTHAALSIGSGSSCGCSPGALASRVALSASLSARAPPLESAAAAHAAVALAPPAALSASLSDRTPRFCNVGGSPCGCSAGFACCARCLSQCTHAASFAMSTAAHAFEALASLAALNASLSARMPPRRNGSGSPCGRSTRLACCPRCLA